MRKYFLISFLNVIGVLKIVFGIFKDEGINYI